jgi:Uma2 family endonuclease
MLRLTSSSRKLGDPIGMGPAQPEHQNHLQESGRFLSMASRRRTSHGLRTSDVRVVTGGRKSGQMSKSIMD